MQFQTIDFQRNISSIKNNPRFRTGEVAFRITSSEDNTIRPAPETQGNAVYFAQGILETEQDTIVATRNGDISSR